MLAHHALLIVQAVRITQAVLLAQVN